MRHFGALGVVTRGYFWMMCAIWRKSKHIIQALAASDAGPGVRLVLGRAPGTGLHAKQSRLINFRCDQRFATSVARFDSGSVIGPAVSAEHVSPPKKFRGHKFTSSTRPQLEVVAQCYTYRTTAGTASALPSRLTPRRLYWSVCRSLRSRR